MKRRFGGIRGIEGNDYFSATVTRFALAALLQLTMITMLLAEQETKKQRCQEDFTSTGEAFSRHAWRQ